MYMENDTQHVTVSITRGNQYFNCIQTTTVIQGSKFVNMTTTIETIADNVSLDWLQTQIEASALPVGSDRPNTIGFLAEGVKAFGQIIFNQNLPEIKSNPSIETGSTKVDLLYALCGESTAEIGLSATTYSVTDNLDYYVDEQTINNFFNLQIDANLKPETRDNLSLPIPFNYQAELKINNLNYIAVRDSGMIPKFANDPVFNLVFINNEVAIFEVKK